MSHRTSTNVGREGAFPPWVHVRTPNPIREQTAVWRVPIPWKSMEFRWGLFTDRPVTARLREVPPPGGGAKGAGRKTERETHTGPSTHPSPTQVNGVVMVC